MAGLSRRLAGVTAALLVMLAAGGCGYTSGSLLPPEVQTVAIDVFENDTYRRGIEVDLTRAVKAQLRTRTHLREARSEATADSILRGTILDVEERVLSEGADDEVLEEQVTITVHVEWVAADGRVLAELPRIRGSAEIASGRGEAIAAGTREALAELAERIVISLEERAW